MELFTAVEAAEILKISPQTIRRMVRAREINGYVVKGRYRILKKDLYEKFPFLEVLELMKEADKNPFFAQKPEPENSYRVNTQEESTDNNDQLHLFQNSPWHNEETNDEE
ncbi:helix-turn-helix domain-containing protein [Candidatus Riflebacteria bacterium]